MPTFSIILPVYNRAATLERCVRSVLIQTFTDWEMLAVDDASTDDSVAVLEQFGDARIRVLRHETNRGAAAARNTAIRSAQGEILALIDSDDAWLPKKLAEQFALLKSGACDLCGCDYLLIENGVERPVQLPEPDSWREVLHTRCELGNGTTLAVPRRVVDAVGLLDETLRLYEDWDWVLRMLVQFRYGVVRQRLAQIHVGAPRPAKVVARSADQFLAKHEGEFLRLGRRHWRYVRGKHHEFVAANAYTLRQFGLGSRHLVKSFCANPMQNPLRLVSLMLAPIDAWCGTSFIQRGAAWQRKLSRAPR